MPEVKAKPVYALSIKQPWACVIESKSPWFVGKYGFMLANPILYDKPIPCRGQLGFFKPDIKGE